MKVTDYKDYFGKLPEDLKAEEYERLVTYFRLLSKVENPVASLLIPVYRTKETLLGHIMSLSNLKTIIPYEIIFIDNNADETTRGILNSLGAKVVKQPNQGITYARQKGLEESKGEIICTMDPDSIYAPYYIDRMVMPFFKDSEQVVGYALTKRYKSAFELDWKLKIRNWLKLNYYKLILKSNRARQTKYVRGVAMAFRKEVFEPIGYLTDVRVAPGCDDGLVSMCLSDKGNFKFVPIDVFTAMPPPRDPSKPFPFCNERFLPPEVYIEKTISSLQIEKAP